MAEAGTGTSEAFEALHLLRSTLVGFAEWARHAPGSLTSPGPPVQRYRAPTGDVPDETGVPQPGQTEGELSEQLCGMVRSGVLAAGFANVGGKRFFAGGSTTLSEAQLQKLADLAPTEALLEIKTARGVLLAGRWGEAEFACEAPAELPWEVEEWLSAWQRNPALARAGEPQVVDLRNAKVAKSMEAIGELA